ncbi:MAG: Hpt domain-containing protein [Pseudomonadota bacterium]
MSTPAAILDCDMLDRNTMADRALQREVFELLFDQVPVYLGQMAAAVVDQDRSAWKAAAHGIKGGARNMGWMQLGETAARCEEAAVPTSDLLAAVDSDYAAARTAAEAYLAQN